MFIVHLVCSSKLILVSLTSRMQTQPIAGDVSYATVINLVISEIVSMPGPKLSTYYESNSTNYSQ